MARCDEGTAPDVEAAAKNAVIDRCNRFRSFPPSGSAGGNVFPVASFSSFSWMLLIRLCLSAQWCAAKSEARCSCAAG